MTAALASIAPRLSKLVLLLSSDSDGEVLGAVRALDRVLKSNQLDWHDLAKSICSADQGDDWRDVLAFCATYMAVLNAREKEFLRGIARRSNLSAKQLDWLNAIADKLRGGP